MFSKDVELVPIRKGFGEGLVQAGKHDKNVVALCADLTESTQMHLFQKEFPNRFVEMGVAEQNLATVASGMAAMGKIPFCSSYAMFSPGRNWEQIRTTIAYNDRPVKIVGSHAGISVGPDGGTHQAIEDIALMRVMPNMVVISPCDAIEARKATLATAVDSAPAYLRLAREKTPIITTEDALFEIGKAYVLFAAESPRFALIATGSLVYEALLAAKTLTEKGLGCVVINVPTIKPLDTETIDAVVQGLGEHGGVVSIEEHQVAGGLGGALAEHFAATKPTPMRFIGVHDKFGQSGTPAELVAHYGMDAAAICAAVESF